MSSKVSKGIALLLFGILLCAGGGGNQRHDSVQSR